MKHIFLFFILTTSLSTFAQNTGSITGKLIDLNSNGEPLVFANILIKGTIKGTTSDFDGLYEINNIEPGLQTVIYSFIGYESQETEVNIEANKVTKIDVSMVASTASLNEIIISTTIKRESETALLLEQKNAIEITQSIGADELSRKGISNAAGAVAKISGVSKLEGSSNVYVRGLGDRYLNTSMNGLALPSNDVNKKNIDLNLFSSDIIENISVSKAYSVKYYGDFSAGNVNINSKDYSGDWFFDAFTATGFNTNSVGKNFVKSEGTGYFGYYGRYNQNPFNVILSHGVDPVSAGSPIDFGFGASTGKSFNFKNGSRLSVFATASFGNNYEYRKGSAVDYTLVEKKAFDNNAEEYEYDTNTTAMLNVNYRFDDNNSFKYNFLFINNSSDVVGYFGIDGKGRNRDARLNTDEGFYQMNVQFDQTQMIVNQLLGTHSSGKFDLDWGFGYNYVSSNQPDRKRVSVENYQYALDDNLDTNPVFYTNVIYDNQRYFQNIQDEEYNGRVNLAYNVNEKLKLNFGYNGRSKQRNFENIRYGYDIVDFNYQITDVNNFNSIFTLDNLNLNPGDDGVYEIKVFNNIPGLSNTNRPGLPENTFQGNLNVYAGYVDAEIKAGEKWVIVPGIRLESFQQDIAFNVINLGNQGENQINSYENLFLPSLNIKYALTDEQNLRFSASQTVSIPEFKEVSPFVYEDISTRIGGNPDLLDIGYSKITNLDLKYEWFYSKSEIFSVGLFGKQIDNPVNLVVGADATGTQRYFRTGEKAHVYGIEIELRKNILTNKNDESKLSIGFNGTYMKTKQDLYSSIDGNYYDVSFTKSEDALQGASPLLLNADINYSPTFGNYKPVANLVFSYFADRIDAIGSGQLGDIIEKGIPTLDFILRNSIGENLEINFSMMNLLNPTIEYYRETVLGDIAVNSANGKGITEYKRGMDLGLQLKYKF